VEEKKAKIICSKTEIKNNPVNLAVEELAEIFLPGNRNLRTCS